MEGGYISSCLRGEFREAKPSWTVPRGPRTPQACA
jgi:hypothetical protein